MESSVTTHRIKIDRDKCCGYALCAEACPELYSLDEEGFIIVNEVEVPSGMLEKARMGADMCPELAIKIVGDRVVSSPADIFPIRGMM